jgi:hypothetical protein
MAGWNDLPTETKETIVKMVDDEQTVRLGEARRSAPSFDTLLALGSMNRELRMLVSPILWQVSSL